MFSNFTWSTCDVSDSSPMRKIRGDGVSNWIVAYFCLSVCSDKQVLSSDTGYLMDGWIEGEQSLSKA